MLRDDGFIDGISVFIIGSFSLVSDVQVERLERIVDCGDMVDVVDIFDVRAVVVLEFFRQASDDVDGLFPVLKTSTSEFADGTPLGAMVW